MVFPLAIIIPFYKSSFFKETIQSLIAQTDQRFMVYIGDDESPDDIKAILKEVNNDTWVSGKVVLKRFDKNLGKISLVKQWERCIAMATQEQWIWLFSDDDVMAPNCVEGFYKALAENGNYELYKFNTHVVDWKGETIKNYSGEHTGELQAFDLIMGKITGRLHTFVVEYIFSRKIFNETNGFVEFPLAWGSDDATWVKFSGKRGIYIIPYGIVFWRLSQKNITGDLSRNGMVKMNAVLLYGKWIIQYFRKHKEIEELKKAMRNFILQQVGEYVPVITPKIFLKLFFSGSKIWGFKLKQVVSFAYHKNKTSLKTKTA